MLNRVWILNAPFQLCTEGVSVFHLAKENSLVSVGSTDSTVAACVYDAYVVIRFRSLESNQTRLLSNLLMGSSADGMHFPCPRLRLRGWSRDTGPAVPSHVSLLILHTQPG